MWFYPVYTVKMFLKIRFILFFFVSLWVCLHHAYAILSQSKTLEIKGIDELHRQKILDNPDITALLESNDSVFDTAKIEHKLKDILLVYGFFDATVRVGYNTDNHHYIATLNTGKQYQIASIYIDQPPSVSVPLELIRIKQGDNFNGFKLLKDEKRILNFLGTQECRYIKRVKHSVTLNKHSKTVAVVFDVGVSPPSKFGTNNFMGLNTVSHDILNPLLDYQMGDCYNEKKINNSVKNVINTNLFNTVFYEITPQKKDDRGISKVDVIYTFEERKHRSYNYGIGVSDTEAMIISAGHEWRNFARQGINLNIQTRLSDRSQNLNFKGQYPSYFGFRENLNSGVTVARERLQTYDSDSISGFVGYEKLPHSQTFYSYGGGIRSSFAKVKQSNIISEDYFITAIPLYGLYDSRDDMLRPKVGETLKLDIMPAVNILKVQNNFIKNQITGTHFMNVGSIGNPQDHAPTILAFRSTIGNIIGTSRDNVPLIERFFSGGGGSVRGYQYQNLGEAQSGIAIGGTSLFETSLEGRIGIKDNYGIVVFVDGGNVYKDAIPKIGSLQFAAGLGGRYYSDIIPVRFDIGIPLNPRDGRRDNFGFYIGIGESF